MGGAAQVDGRRGLPLARRPRLRECELGRTDNKAFSPSRGLRWRDVEWHAVGSLNPTHAALTVHLCAAKDGEGAGPRFPMQIRRRAAGNSAANDALCAYDLLSAAWREDSSLLGGVTALDTPIFRNSARGGAASAFETRDVRAIVREIASAAGEDPAAWQVWALPTARIWSCVTWLPPLIEADPRIRRSRDPP